MHEIQRLHLIHIGRNTRIPRNIVHGDLFEDIDDHHAAVEDRISPDAVTYHSAAAEHVHIREAIDKMRQRNKHPVDAREIHTGGDGKHNVLARPDADEIRDRNDTGCDRSQPQIASEFLGFMERFAAIGKIDRRDHRGQNRKHGSNGVFHGRLLSHRAFTKLYQTSAASSMR